MKTGWIIVAGLPLPAMAATPDAMPVNLSVAQMFWSADWVVKAVMIGLVLASILSWTVGIAKSLELSRAARTAQGEYEAIDAAAMLSAAPDGPLVAAARTELALSADALGDRDGVKERIVSRFDRLEAADARIMGRGLAILATIGAVAPFVGLFGTVWGIMNAFIGIAEKQTTNLAVVAPGIAEALLATALGLVAAIPAVILYNHLTRGLAAQRARTADAAAAVLRLVSRDLSRGGRA